MTGTWNGQEHEIMDFADMLSPHSMERLEKILDTVHQCIYLIDKTEDGDMFQEKVEPLVYNLLKDMADELWL